MLVDKKNFKVYELDGKESIKERIAATKQTLPNYIHFIYEPNAEGGEDIRTQLISQDIEKATIIKIEECYQECVDTYKISIDDFAKLWYIHNLGMGKNIDPHREFLFTDFLEKHKIIYKIMVSEIPQFNKDYNEKMKRLIDKVRKRTSIFIKFEKFKPVHSTPCETVRIKTELQFEADYDIYELFNALKMSRDIPFAVIRDYYKILKNYVPSEKWTYTRERQEGDFKDKQDVLFLKVLNLKNEPLKNIDKTDPSLYSTVTIYFESQAEEEKRLREKERISK